MNFRELTYEAIGRVAKIRIDRPEYRNAISRITIEELDAAFAAACDDDDIGTIVLCAEGPHFSGGHDIGSPAKLQDDQARPFPEGVRGNFHRSWYLYIEHGLRWRSLPKPTIAAVHGKCIWGGWMVATTMDMIFAARDAQFLGSNFQYFSVPWDLGIRKAKEILFEPRFIGAIEARDLGFVNRVYDTYDELIEETMAYAARVAENSIFQLRMTKNFINQAQDIQGYTNHIIAAHTKPGGPGVTGRGAQLGSGERRIAPIDRALRNEGLATGLRAK